MWEDCMPRGRTQPVRHHCAQFTTSLSLPGWVTAFGDSLPSTTEETFSHQKEREVRATASCLLLLKLGASCYCLLSATAWNLEINFVLLPPGSLRATKCYCLSSSWYYCPPSSYCLKLGATMSSPSFVFVLLPHFAFVLLPPGSYCSHKLPATGFLLPATCYYLIFLLLLQYFHSFC